MINGLMLDGLDLVRIGVTQDRSRGNLALISNETIP